MKLKFLGGTRTVTGVKFLIEAKSKARKIIRILIDCGMVQGERKTREENYKDFSFNPSEIDYLLITHAHIDHIGLLPKLYKDGFRGKIFATPPTIDLARLTLEDSQGILEREAREINRESLYQKEDIDGALTLVKAAGYKRKRKLADNIYFQFREAGHILGSAIIELWAERKKIVFSGDLGNAPIPLLSPPAKIRKADYILIESTYGNRIHEDRKERKELLENTIEDTFSKRGVLIIPIFAIERTQELLCELNELVENNRIPRLPIFIDSPLAIKATQVYKKYSDYFNRQASRLIKKGDDLFKFPGLILTEKVEESKGINRVSPPKIIIAGSGMSTGGRVLFHEKIYLPNSNNSLLLINFQVKGTLGRQISEGAKEVEIFNERVPVRARIISISGYSSHADQQDLYNWLANFSKPIKQIFVVHGEEEASMSLAQRVRDHLGIGASAPSLGKVVEL